MRVRAEVRTAYRGEWIRGWFQGLRRSGEREIRVQIVDDPENKKGRYSTKILYRRVLPKPVVGVLIGRTSRRTGWRYNAWDYDDVSFFEPTSTHRVYLIARGLQWRRPMEALEGDIEAVEETLERPEEGAGAESGGNGTLRYMLLFREGFAQMVQDLSEVTDGPEELFANVFASGCVQVKVIDG